MAKRTGKDLAFLISSTALRVQRNWSVEDTDEDVVTTAAGDPVVDRDSLRGDHTVEASGLLEIASPYLIPNTVRGTKTAWAAKIQSADANGIVSGTSKVKRFRISAAYDGVVETAITLEAAAVDLSWDLTPL